MTQTVEATYDGQVLRPAKPISLPPNTRVTVTIETADGAAPESQSFLQTAQALNLQGPADWSTRFEEYLYNNGTPSDE